MILMLSALPIQASDTPVIKFEDRIEEYNLKNGLKVILIEDKRSSNVVSSIWYKVGSSYEKDGITGISHLLEHMMFKATSTTKNGEFSEEIKKVGGTENAFTSRDFTGYYQKVNSKYLSMCLKYESDRMTNLIFKDTDLKSEREVVKEERRLRTEDRPISVIFEKINLQILGMQKYGIPIIGTMNDLEKISTQDLELWYKKYYRPSNAILIIAGNFNEKTIRNEIDAFFGEIQNPQNNILEKNNFLKSTPSFKDISIKEKLPNPLLVISYIKPNFESSSKKDAYALDILLEIMDGGFSSRFTHNIIDKKLALNTFISHDLYSKEQSIFSIGGTPRKNVLLDDIQKSLISEFKLIAMNGLDNQELNDTKSRIIARNIFKFDSVFNQVMAIGGLEAKGLSWRLLDQYVDDIDKINESDIKMAAKRFVLDNKAQISTIYPQ